MPLEIHFDSVDSLPLDLAGITPDKLQTLTLAEAERLTIRLGRDCLPLAEVTTPKGSPSDGQLRLVGDLTRAVHVGAEMKSGELVVEGHVGHFAGMQMTGGTLQIEGSAANALGAEMRGGIIRVTGDAGDRAGANLPGSKRGMNGGAILIHGNAGQELGMRMRRGLIAVAGDVGPFAGRQMLAGTILIGGNCGPYAGADMRRGTLCVLGSEIPQLVDTFHMGCRGQFPVLGLLEQHLRSFDFPLREHLAAREFQIVHGDLLESGRGEIFRAVGAMSSRLQ